MSGLRSLNLTSLRPCILAIDAPVSPNLTLTVPWAVSFARAGTARAGTARAGTARAGTDRAGTAGGGVNREAVAMAWAGGGDCSGAV